MKTQKSVKAMLVMAGLLFSIALQAKALSPMVISTQAMPGKKIALTITNAPGRFVNVLIKTELGEVLVDERKRSRDTVYTFVYNMSQLADGRYSLKVESDEKIYNAQFELYDDYCNILKKTEWYKPLFESEKDDISITFRNPESENVYVEFHNSNGSFFKDELQQIRFFKRKYNIEMLEPGDYQVVLLAGEREFSYPFEVR